MDVEPLFDVNVANSNFDFDTAKGLARPGCKCCWGKGYVEVWTPWGSVLYRYCPKSLCSLFKLRREVIPKVPLEQKVKVFGWGVKGVKDVDG